MKLLFIIDHEPEKNSNQVIMVVPDEYDRTQVRREAQECGVRSPNILVEMDIPHEARRMFDYTDDYAVYSR